MIGLAEFASRRRPARRAVSLATVAAGGLALAVAAPSGAAHHRRPPRRAAGPRVLRVGRWHGKTGTFSSIQAAVDAAGPGDWILFGPGDYHEQADRQANHAPQNGDTPAAVIITTPGIHLRGMDRNRV